MCNLPVLAQCYYYVQALQINTLNHLEILQADTLLKLIFLFAVVA